MSRWPQILPAGRVRAGIAVPRIFISYSSMDNAPAITLRDWLVGEGWDDLFLETLTQNGASLPASVGSVRSTRLRCGARPSWGWLLLSERSGKALVCLYFAAEYYSLGSGKSRPGSNG